MARDLPQVYADNPITSFEDDDLFYGVRGTTNFGTTFEALADAIGGVGSVAWGGITGTLSAQVDLQSALDAKLAVSVAASTYQPINVVTVANEATDTTCFPLFVTAATGDLGPKSNSEFRFNSLTGALTAGSFIGDGNNLQALDVANVTEGVLSAQNGGTGIDNAGRTVTTAGDVSLGGNFSTSSTASITGALSIGGAFSTTGTFTSGGNFSTSSTVSITGALTLGTDFTTSGNVLTFNTFAYTFPGTVATMLYSGGALGTPASGTLTSCTVDGANLLGYRGAPQFSYSTDHTLVLGEAGGCIFHPVGDNNARAFTIPANGSVAYPIGTIIEFINMAAASCTIPITTDTMTLLPAGTTGTRTLAQYGRASAEKITSTSWIISGNSALT